MPNTGCFSVGSTSARPAERQALHHIRRGANARKDDALRVLHFFRVRRDGGGRIQPLQREQNRRQIRAAAIDDNRIGSHHSTPFVVGRSSPSRRNACLQRTADAFEAGLDHVVRVLTLHAHLKRRAEGVGERTEEVRDELGRQATHLIAIELAFERCVRAAGEIDRDLRLRFVHRE